MTAPAGLQFGRKASQVPSAENRELYLVNFKKGKNIITCWEPDPSEWIQTREHFDHWRQMGFACAVFAGAASCMGCDWPVEHPEWTWEWLRDKAQNLDEMDRQKRTELDPGWSIKEPSDKWFLRAVNEDGFNRVYRIGYTLYATFKEFAADPDYGPLNNQVYEVKKSGEGFGTKHIVVPTRRDPIKGKYPMTPDSEIFDALGKKYLDAFNRYVELGLVDEAGRVTEEAGHDGPREEVPAAEQAPQADEAQAAEPTSDIVKDSLNKAKTTQAAKATNPLVKAAGGVATPDLPRGVTADMEIPEGWNPHLNAREADTVDLKDWLDRHPAGAVDYPARAPRSVLVGLVEKSQVPFNGAGV